MAFGTPISQFDLQNAQALKEQLANYQGQVAWGENRQAAPGILAALSQMSQQGQNAPQPPMPGQPSMPSQPPMGGPNISSMPPMNAPQASQNGIPTGPMSAPSQAPAPPPDPNMGGLANQPGASGPMQPGAAGPSISQAPPPQQNSQFGQSGYSLQQMVGAIKNAMPNASPQVMLSALTQAQGVLNNDAKQQLAMLKSYYMPQTMAARTENATSGKERADAQVNRTNLETAKTLDPNNPSPPVNYITPDGPGGVPTISPTSPARTSAAGGKEIMSKAQGLGEIDAPLSYASGQVAQLAMKVKQEADHIDQGKLKPFNSLANFYKTKTTDPQLITLKSDLRTLAYEHLRQTKGGTPTAGEVNDFISTMTANLGKTGIGTAVDAAVGQGNIAQKSMSDAKASLSSGGAQSSSGGATHRWNPDTGALDEIK